MSMETLKYTVNLFNSKNDTEIAKMHKLKELVRLYKSLTNQTPNTTLSNSKYKLIKRIRMYINNIRSTIETRLMYEGVMGTIMKEGYELIGLFVSNLDELIDNERKALGLCN